MLIDFDIDTPLFGKIQLSRPEKGGWGDLLCLKGTLWGDLIPEVSGESFSHATYKRVQPLLKELGPPPKTLYARIQNPHRLCDTRGVCISYKEGKCHPHKKVPSCYVAPGLTVEQQLAVHHVMTAWKQDRYVIVVIGKEFVI